MTHSDECEWLGGVVVQCRCASGRSRVLEALGFLEAMTSALRNHTQPEDLWWRLEEIGRNISEMGRQAKLALEAQTPVIDRLPSDD